MKKSMDANSKDPLTSVECVQIIMVVMILSAIGYRRSQCEDLKRSELGKRLLWGLKRRNLNVSLTRALGVLCPTQCN